MRFSLIPFSLLLGSCGAFFPGRSDSGLQEGEVVRVELECHALPPPAQNRFAGSGAAVGVLAGFAVDAIASELKREASRYEAQFTGSANGWNSASGQDGMPSLLTIKRKLASDKGSEVSFKFAAKFESRGLPGAGKLRVLTLHPSFLSVQNAKAKILSDDWRWWILPTAWWGKIFATDGHHVGVQVDIVLTGTWVNQKGTVESRSAAIVVPEIQVNMDAPKGCPKGAYSFLDNPLQLAAGSFPIGSLFSVRVTVTERDPSNAKKYLVSLAKSVADKRETIIKFIEEKVEPPKEDNSQE